MLEDLLEPIPPQANAPHTAPDAMVIAYRDVIGRPVIEITELSGASYRNASFTGYLEVVDADALAVARDGIGRRKVRALLTWFGWAPQRRFVEVTVTGRCTAHPAYSGPVVAELEYPPDRPSRATT